jgi:hypothetical protein
MAVGLLIGLDGRWIAAVPLIGLAAGAMWLVGAWVLPWTRDAHIRRVLRTWGTWASEAQWTRAELERQRAKFIERLRALEPPADRVGQHEQLVSLTEEQDRLWRQWPRTPALLSEMTAVQRAMRGVGTKLIADAGLESQASYAVALDRLFASAREAYAKMAARSEAATERALRGLEQITPPLTGQAEHALLTAGFQKHLDTARRFHAACRASDPKSVEAAAVDWERSVRDLRGLVARLGDELEHDRRWSAPLVGPPATDAKRD